MQRTLEASFTDALIGGIAGLSATAPMTVAMIFLHHRLPQRERYPLPPREIVEHLADAAGKAHQMDRPWAAALTLAAHFGYGAGMGMVYGLAVKPARRSGWAGAGFGLIVWSASYLGLLPAMGLLPSATEHPPRRNLLMIGAHLLWGAALGWLARVFTRETQPQAPLGPGAS